MAAHTDIFVFGDQTVAVLDQLRDLLLIRNNELLSTFFTDAFSAIQHEIAALPPTEKLRFPQRESLALLVDALRNSPPHAALDSAFCCLYEIGSYIEYIARSGRQHPPTNRSFLLGICTGSLAAAAVTCSTNLFELQRLGIEAVIVAFRTGMHVHLRAANLGYSEPGCWSVILPLTKEDDAEQALTAFCNEKALPTALEPYVSAVGAKFVTISGPPSVLDEVRSLKAFSGKTLHPVPIRGPYHTQHVYSETDLNQLVDSILRGLELLGKEASIPIISCASGALYKTNYEDLLRKFLSEILAKQMRIDRVIDGICEIIHKENSTTWVVPIHTPIADNLASALASRTGADVRSQKPLSGLAGRSPGQNASRHAVADETKIAIIGFSGRFPGADGNAEFWDMLMQGLDVHQRIPEDRFPHDHYDPTGKRKNTSKVQWGCFLKNAGLFDPSFFHLSPKEATQTDPAQRLGLLTAYEALEMAGFVPDRTSSTQRDRVGVYYGSTSNDWGEVNTAQDIDTYYIPGANRAFIPGKINYFFKFSGPSIAVDTACSSSLAAIDMAINALLQKDIDTAIAGGTNVLSNPDNYAGLDRGHFLSRTGNCKTFDDGADGYCRADGVGTVILKRLPDALKDKDPIYGIILGAATNHNAESVSITRPLADAQEYLFKRLLNSAGIAPHDVSYIEMHGTGTQAGDAVEMTSVLDSFAWDYSRPRDKSLHLGSVKANVGHGESASGVTALIKVLLMMQNNLVPPHCGIKTKINHGFPTDLEKRNVRIAMKGTAEEWQRPENGVRRALVNNFSAAGGNSSLLLEDSPAIFTEALDVSADPRNYHSIVVSGQSVKSLELNLQSLADMIGYGKSDHTMLTQIAYTTTARRMHHNRRVALVSNDSQDLRRQLLHAATLASGVKAVPAKTPELGFLFTGQGTQDTGMGSQLYRHFSSFRSDIHEFDAIARLHGLPSILPLVDGSIVIDQLSATVIQLGTCIVQIALARFWINLGMKPQYVIGHSLGEYAALHVAGVLSVSDTIFLCGHRAALLEDKCTPGTHSMLAVRGSISRNHIPGALPLEIACINTPEDTVLSGQSTDINAMSLRLEQQGYKSTKLDLPFAFHSSQVDPVLDDLERLASRVEFHDPAIPFVSTLLAKKVTSSNDIGPQYIKRHCRETVDFNGAIMAAGIDNIMTKEGVCIEIGTHPLLSRMVKVIQGSNVKCCPSLRRNEDCFKTLSESLNTLHLVGLPVNWNEYHRDFPMSHKVIKLPSYNWQLAQYWFPYQYSWCLTKGDAPQETSKAQHIKQKPLRLSDSVQELLQESHDKTKSSILIQSDVHDPGLSTVVQQHRVNGVKLCPSTLYADLAYTLAMYLLESQKSDKLQGFNASIKNMAAEAALIINENGPQYFKASMEIDWTALSGSMEVYTTDANGKGKTRHAACDIQITNPEIHSQYWNRYQYLINQAMSGLRNDQEGTVHRLKRSVAYKLFHNSVQYGSAYHGMQDVWFDSHGLVATTNVRIPSSNGDFRLNPFCCDSLGHITGFIMNCNDELDIADHIYINHGWRYLTLCEPYVAEVEYQTWVRMYPTGDDDSVYSGDVHVLRDGKIIAICGGVTFKKVPKKVLEMMLPSSTGAAKNAKKTKAASAPEVQKPITPPESDSEDLPVALTGQSAEKQEGGSAPSVLQKALEIVADEIGVEQDKLTDSFTFADQGVDSLMSLTILGCFREELDLDIPASDFNKLASVKDLKDYFISKFSTDFNAGTSAGGMETPSSGVSSQASSPMLSSTGTGATTPLSTIEEKALPVAVESIPRSTSMLLQGTKNCSKTLWLFPDGAGSATSYVTLPSISSDLRVYGLNSPYLTKPREFKCALQDITTSYVAELRRRQPTGPYYLAGWSAGGVSAFDAARQLTEAGEVVESLILIDSPNPIGLGKLPPRMYSFLESSGIFGAFEESGQDSTAPPDWLFQHFLVFIEALDKYQPVPFNEGASPKTTIIWARDGVCKHPSDPRPEPQEDDPKGMTWLLDNRTDFGPNGWDDFISAKNIETHSVSDSNHFTLMREPRAAVLCDLVKKAMSI